MKFEDWPDSTKAQLSLDIDLFLKKMGSKYRVGITRVDLDAEGAFAFKVGDKASETDEERSKRMERAEYYLRAWLALTGHPAKPPSEKWRLFDQEIEVRFPDPIEGEKVLTYVGKVVDVDHVAFPRDPLLVVQNTGPRSKDPNSYVELVECYSSQVVSWSSKSSRAKLVKGTGDRIIDFPSRNEDEYDDDGPDVS